MEFARLFTYLLFLSGIFGAITNSYADLDPEWMVRIEKTTSSGEKIIGTGYVLKVGDENYIRTASHVTLGSPKGMVVYNYKGKKVAISESEYVSNNSYDDFMVKVIDEGISALGIYAPRLNKFIIEEKIYKRFKNHRRKNYLEDRFGRSKFANSSYVTPERIEKKRRDMKFEYERFSLFSPSDHLMHERDPQYYRGSLVASVDLANRDILPGESGSPVVRWDYDLSKEYFVEILEKGFISDLNGRQIEYKSFRGDTDFVYPYVSGHVLAYHRLFKFSKFLSSREFAKLNIFLLRGNRGDMSDVTWQYQSGVSYRVSNTAKEAVFSNYKNSGDGTAGDGGDGTAGDGGDGTAGDGGDGTAGDGGDGIVKSKFLAGMEFEGKQILSFRISNGHNGKYKGKYIAANWLNLQFLQQQQKIYGNDYFEVVGPERPMSVLLRDRLIDNGEPVFLEYENSRNQDLRTDNRYNIYLKRKMCVIDLSKLNQDLLKLHIIYPMNYSVEKINIEKPLRSISPLITAKMGDGNEMFIDLTGLWGVDLSSIGTLNGKIEDMPYVSIKRSDDGTSRVQCFPGVPN